MKMRGSDTVKEDFKTQIFDIFGTVDLEQLRAIAQKVQLIESEKPHNERGAGRKNSLTPQQLAEMLALHQQGMGATELAKKYGINAAQLCIRYVIELGAVALPKTANPDHMASNAAVDFTISSEDMETLKHTDRIADYGEFNIFPVFSGKPLA